MVATISGLALAVMLAALLAGLIAGFWFGGWWAAVGLLLAVVLVWPLMFYGWRR